MKMSRNRRSNHIAAAGSSRGARRRGQRRGGSRRLHGGTNAWTNASRGAGEAFVFGFEYTHFFYTLSPVPPHQLLATSAEFCVGSMQDGADCESVQFISGLT